MRAGRGSVIPTPPCPDWCRVRSHKRPGWDNPKTWPDGTVEHSHTCLHTLGTVASYTVTVDRFATYWDNKLKVERASVNLGGVAMTPKQALKLAGLLLAAVEEAQR